MAIITVQNTNISVIQYKEEDYISLSDVARSQMPLEYVPKQGDMEALMLIGI